MSFNFAYNWSYYPISDQPNLITNILDDTDITISFYPIWYKRAALEWTIPSAWGACTFNVYRGPSDAGPFEKLNATPINSNYFKDTTSLAIDKFNQDYYILEVVKPDNSIVQTSPRTWQATRRDFIQLKAQDIQRREWFLLSRIAGAESMIFRRKSYGKRCSHCWNETTERVMDDNCKYCLGTSFEGGYFPGFSTFIQYDATPNQTYFQYFGKFQPNQIGAWTTCVPDIGSLDLVLRLPDWKMYRVIQVANTELKTVKVKQMLQIIELDKTSVEYQLAIQQMPGDYQS